MFSNPEWRAASGFQRRDTVNQRHVFSRHARSHGSGVNTLNFSNLPQALADIHANASNISTNVDENCDSAIDFSEFQAAAVAASPLERWLSRIPLAQIISDAMPPEISGKGMDEGMLRALADLPADVIQASLQAAVVGMLQVPLRALALARRLVPHSLLFSAGCFAAAVCPAKFVAAATRARRLIPFQISGAVCAGACICAWLICASVSADEDVCWDHRRLS
jgi:hypothetical protein